MDSMANTSRTWAVLTALFGLATLATILAFGALPPVQAAGACMTDGIVLHFEFARSQTDLDAIFGLAGSECRDKRIAALDAINTIDVWVFIPAYTAFVCCAALFLSGGVLRTFAWSAIAVAFVALGADYIETLNLLAYTPDLAPAPERLIESSSAAWIKFFALGVNGLLLAALCFTGSPRRPILGALLCLPLVGVTLMFADLRLIQAQSLAFFASWTPLLVMAAKTAISGRA
jgi:hypothetical protein